MCRVFALLTCRVSFDNSPQILFSRKCVYMAVNTWALVLLLVFFSEVDEFLFLGKWCSFRCALSQIFKMGNKKDIGLDLFSFNCFSSSQPNFARETEHFTPLVCIFCWCLKKSFFQFFGMDKRRLWITKTGSRISRGQDFKFLVSFQSVFKGGVLGSASKCKKM